ncbi:MAG TPA: hypothetical protein VFB62_10485, partial [Polyangiaceae bacterium]|nr:hypothetical protein [Polyangiaceae bacterium]
VVNVVRESERAVAWQVGRFVRVFDMKGKEILHAEGNLLGRCPDGKLLAWRKAKDRWELFGVRNDIPVATVARKPGFVLGVDPDCRRLFVQRHDGELLSIVLGQESPRTLVEPAPIASAGAGYVSEGYAYDTRPSAARDDLPAGLWVAFSSGAMVRLDGPDGRVRAYGHATPRATAMADGIHPGELIFADDTGVVLRTPGARDRVLLAASGDRSYEDLRVLPDGRTALLSWAHGVAMLELERGEILQELELPARGRLAKWDDEGSLLVWPFSFEGHARGDIIPIGATFVGDIASRASNLRARLGPDLQPLIELAD